MSTPATVVGADGCPGGWVAAFVTGRAVSWRLFASFAALLAAAGTAPVGVDIPIGLPEPGGRRRADLAARAHLGPAASSIFWTPAADVVDRWRADPVHPRGIGVSVQTWNIVDKIVDVASCDRADVLEVHPECSFRALAPAVAFVSKKTPPGVAQRLAALRTWCDVPPTTGRGVFEDAVDATVVAWTVARAVRGEAFTLPADPGPGEPVVTV